MVREHYLRDDIYCGAPFCNVCDVSGARLSSTASRILIVDTNIVLNQVRKFFLPPNRFKGSSLLDCEKGVFFLKEFS